MPRATHLAVRRQIGEISISYFAAIKVGVGNAGEHGEVQTRSSDNALIGFVVQVLGRAHKALVDAMAVSDVAFVKHFGVLRGSCSASDNAGGRAMELQMRAVVVGTLYYVTKRRGAQSSSNKKWNSHGQEGVLSRYLIYLAQHNLV